MLAAKVASASTNVAEWRRRLQNDAEFQPLTQLRKDNAYQGFRALLSDERLPGDTLQDRMEFVLDLTADNAVAPTHFSSEISFSDGGLRDELRDSPIWGTTWSNQIGHFLTAVDMGQRAISRKGMYAAMAMGHELTGDLVKGGGYRTIGGLLRQSLNVANQLAHGLKPSVLRAFDEGVEAAKNSDTAGVNRAAQAIMGCPDSELEARRSGNSQADIRLTMYGWAWGEIIARGEQTSIHEGLAYLDANLAA
jgi:hypothetical protein